MFYGEFCYDFLKMYIVSLHIALILMRVTYTNNKFSVFLSTHLFLTHHWIGHSVSLKFESNANFNKVALRTVL